MADAMSIAIRAATPQDAPAIAAVRIASWASTYRGLIPDAYLDGMQLEQSIALWDRVLTAGKNNTSVFVAENDGDIVGFAAGNMLAEPRYELDAELSAAYVRRDFQRAGVGRRLIAAVAGAQRDHGARGLIVWVIAGNKGARAFYEQLGATLLVEQPFEWDGMPLVEAGYGFADIDALIEATTVVPRPRDSIAH
jgi:GNAT superfamily N-acetyltransferase